MPVSKVEVIVVGSGFGGSVAPRASPRPAPGSRRWSTNSAARQYASSGVHITAVAPAWG